jgi:hypothetical protein
LARYYIWFIVVVSAVAGLPRVLLARRFAELQLARLQQKTKSTTARSMSIVFFLGALLLAAAYFSPWGHQNWLVVGVIFSLLCAIENFLESLVPTMENMVFQKRLMGILYLGLAAGSVIVVSRL